MSKAWNALYAERVAAGKCGDCGKRRERRDRSRCDACRKRKLANQHKYLKRRAAAGRCTCGNRLNRYKRLCDDCMLHWRKQARSLGGYKPQRKGGPGRPARVKER